MKDPAEVKELINSRVSLADILISDGVSVPQVIKPQQISCPFHGADLSASARYYPDTNSMYCFTCKKSWDIIGYYMETRDLKFMEAARQLASSKGVDLSKLNDIKLIKIRDFRTGQKEKGTTDKKKLAMFALEKGVRACKGIETPKTYGTMVYLLANARQADDEKLFAMAALPLAKKIKKTLS